MFQAFFIHQRVLNGTTFDLRLHGLDNFGFDQFCQSSLQGGFRKWKVLGQLTGRHRVPGVARVLLAVFPYPMNQVAQENSRHDPIFDRILDPEIHRFGRLGRLSHVVVSKGIPTSPIVTFLVVIANPKQSLVFQ